MSHWLFLIQNAPVCSVHAVSSATDKFLTSASNNVSLSNPTMVTWSVVSKARYYSSYLAFRGCVVWECFQVCWVAFRWGGSVGCHSSSPLLPTFPVFFGACWHVVFFCSADLCQLRWISSNCISRSPLSLNSQFAAGCHLVSHAFALAPPLDEDFKLAESLVCWCLHCASLYSHLVEERGHVENTPQLSLSF